MVYLVKTTGSGVEGNLWALRLENGESHPVTDFSGRRGEMGFTLSHGRALSVLCLVGESWRHLGHGRRDGRPMIGRTLSHHKVLEEYR